MGDWMDLKIAEAIVRGADDPAPDVLRAAYQSDTGRVLVDLSNGCSFAFPARLAEGLETATDTQLAAVEVLGVSTLHWEELDVDLSVPHLMAGLFGTAKYMARERARRGGQAKTPAKTAAARSNGALGGRPKKIVITAALPSRALS
jgi:hypothetical protein